MVGLLSWAAHPAHRDASSLQDPWASGRRCRTVLVSEPLAWHSLPTGGACSQGRAVGYCCGVGARESSPFTRQPLLGGSVFSVQW